MSWPGLIVLVAVMMAFLIGQDQEPDVAPLVFNGSKEMGKLAFALVSCSGYFIGDIIARAAFHRRIMRLGIILALVLAANIAALHLRAA
jgi:hypothetical protein